MRQIKLIWDFKGPNSALTAAHHEVHLREFLTREQLPLKITGHEIKHDMHAIAFVVVTDEYLIPLRDRLKPHRATMYEE